MAQKNGTWLALMCSIPFSRLSVGYVGASDGWTDLAHGFQFDWQFDEALNGNVALTGELELATAHEFVLGSRSATRSSERSRLCSRASLNHSSRNAAVSSSNGSARINHTRHSKINRVMAATCSTPATSCCWPMRTKLSKARWWHRSHSLGEAKGDAEAEGGYHLVWTRDLVQSAGGLLAAGNVETPLRSLIYLATSQSDDGSFAQNSWVDGTPFWSGIQLDEVAFPILLAHRLWRSDGLRDFDPYPMVIKAAAYLIRQGPVTRRSVGKKPGDTLRPPWRSTLRPSCAPPISQPTGEMLIPNG